MWLICSGSTSTLVFVLISNCTTHVLVRARVIIVTDQAIGLVRAIALLRPLLLCTCRYETRFVLSLFLRRVMHRRFLRLGEAQALALSGLLR